jgi:hypothetical protein
MMIFGIFASYCGGHLAWFPIPAAFMHPLFPEWHFPHYWAWPSIRNKDTGINPFSSIRVGDHRGDGGGRRCFFSCIDRKFCREKRRSLLVAR